MKCDLNLSILSRFGTAYVIDINRHVYLFVLGDHITIKTNCNGKGLLNAPDHGTIQTHSDQHDDATKPNCNAGNAPEYGKRWFCTPELTAFYVERAKGGVGLIIVGGMSVEVRGMGFNAMLGLYDDKFVASLREFTSALHAAGV